jgi:hypothetical protein
MKTLAAGAVLDPDAWPEGEIKKASLETRKSCD